MGIWQGVAMDSLKFYPGPPCPTLLRSAGTPALKQPYGHFRDGLPIFYTFGHPTLYAYDFISLQVAPTIRQTLNG
jgi:hypothetical protein